MQHPSLLWNINYDKFLVTNATYICTFQSKHICSQSLTDNTFRCLCRNNNYIFTPSAAVFYVQLPHLDTQTGEHKIQLNSIIIK